MVNYKFKTPSWIDNSKTILLASLDHFIFSKIFIFLKQSRIAQNGVFECHLQSALLDHSESGHVRISYPHFKKQCNCKILFSFRLKN